jgi:hypothetical protein
MIIIQNILSTEEATGRKVFVFILSLFFSGKASSALNNKRMNQVG